jgi:hypothetical protein
MDNKKKEREYLRTAAAKICILFVVIFRISTLGLMQT